MKKPVSFPKLFLFSLLFWVAKPALAQQNSTFYYNPVTINGHLLVQETIDLTNRGVLAMVDGDPASRQAKPVAFRVYLQRNGGVVRKGPSSKINEVYSVQLADLLPFAHIGDELVVEPVRQTSKITRRIIKLKSFNWLTWLIQMNEGC
jgi:hypothetical protein